MTVESVLTQHAGSVPYGLGMVPNKYMAVIPAVERWKQEGQKFKAILKV